MPGEWGWCGVGGAGGTLSRTTGKEQAGVTPFWSWPGWMGWSNCLGPSQEGRGRGTLSWFWLKRGWRGEGHPVLVLAGVPLPSLPLGEQTDKLKILPFLVLCRRMVNISVFYFYFKPCNFHITVVYRPHPKMGKVLFSQVSVCSHGGKVPHIHHITSASHNNSTGPRSIQGVLQDRDSSMTGWGTHLQDNMGYPTPRDKLCLDMLCPGWYASCGFPQEDFLVLNNFH